MPTEFNDTEELHNGSQVQDEADVSTETEQSADAQSSGAEDVSETADEGTLSIVRDVVSKTEEEPEAAASSATEANGQETGENQPTEPDNENYSDVPFNKHPRFQQVLGKLRTAETNAQRYENVERFIAEQGLTGEETQELLVIGGMMKTNPVEAWQRVKPVIQQLAVAAGEVLSDDLKQRVQNGDMSREAAIDFSRQRAANTSTTARVDWERQRSQQQAQVETQQRIGSTVNSWEQDRRVRDPNFEAKLPAIEREVAWMQSKEGKPRDADGVKTMLQKAYDTVSASFVNPNPPAAAKPAKRPVTGGQVNGNVRPEITSTLDIIEQVVARRAG